MLKRLNHRIGHPSVIKKSHVYMFSDDWTPVSENDMEHLYRHCYITLQIGSGIPEERLKEEIPVGWRKHMLPHIKATCDVLQFPVLRIKIRKGVLYVEVHPTSSIQRMLAVQLYKYIIITSRSSCMMCGFMNPFSYQLPESYKKKNPQVRRKPWKYCIRRHSLPGQPILCGDCWPHYIKFLEDRGYIQSSRRKMMEKYLSTALKPDEEIKLSTGTKNAIMKYQSAGNSELPYRPLTQKDLDSVLNSKSDLEQEVT